MIDKQKEPDTSKRVIRPWIAGLLTFVGWGVGLYYARKPRAAVYAAFAAVITSVFIGIGLFTFLFFAGPTQISLAGINGRAAIDLINGLIGIFVMIGVWVFVAKQNRNVEQGSPARLWGYLGIWLLPIIGAMVIAVLVRCVFVQPFNAPASSMRPNINSGDYFVVKKWSYGYSRSSLVYPLTRLSWEGRIFASQPKAGDIVVFKNGKDGNKDYVKRLIGQPNDTIQLVNGSLHINGEAVPKEFLGMRDTICDGRNAQAPTYRETLPNGASYLVQECYGDDGQLDDRGPYKVPPGHYFMLGDNRDQSQDSRIITAVGYIPFSDLVGKVHRASDTAK
ncbi:MAG: hypothetical protein DHS20C05_11290 [Hyphococcus sp.]|nr:MAG: hypothetical protein DHS20C05_11290 [Marinicaulis sp.]